MGLKFQNTFLSISSHCGVISGYFSPWPISHHRNFGVRVCWNLYWWILMLNNITTGVCYLGISDDFWNFRPLSFFLLHMVVASMFYIVDLWFRLSGVIYLTDLHQLWNYVSNSSLPVNSKELKIYSAIVCIHILNGIVQDYSYSTDDSIEGVEVGISWLDEFLPILSIASDIIQIFSEYYALSFIFITSLTLNANVEAVAKRIEDAIIQTQHPKEREPGFETIENNLHSKNLKFLPPTVQLEDIIEKVYTLKNIFKIFNKVHGIYAFLFIFEASYLGVVSAFGGKNEALGLNFVLALESALVVFSICLMGTRMHLKASLIWNMDKFFLIYYFNTSFLTLD